MPVTRRQREILDFIAKHLEEKGYAPSFEEIARQFGFQSLATVHEHLTNLERKGYIKRSYNESRAIEILPTEATPRAINYDLLNLTGDGGCPTIVAHLNCGRHRVNKAAQVHS